MTDPDRLREQALEAYGVLDAPPRPDLLSLVELAARCAGVTSASILLATSAGMRRVAAYGAVSPSEVEDTACAAAVRRGRPSLLADDSVHGSQPLTRPDGLVIGTLCVRHERSRPVDEATERALATIAARAVDVLELELAYRRLAAADERLAAFAGQVGHDLRNPLSAIRMSLELARDTVDDDTDLAELLDRAGRGTERMDALIGRLVELARDETADPAQ